MSGRALKQFGRALLNCTWSAVAFLIILQPSFSLSALSDKDAGEQPLRVHFIDVGYGDAVFVEFPDASTMLIDAGESAQTARLMAYLKSLNVQKIDTIIITHPHKNHFEGFFAVNDVLAIGRAFINGDDNAEEGYGKLLEALKNKGVPVNVLKRADHLKGLPSSVTLEILHPAQLSDNPNGNSIVVRLKYGDISFLFTGDIEIKGQNALLAAYPQIVEADCIKIPHHGGPLSDLFIRSFKDTIFIVSTGPNPWGLPKDEDLQRLHGKVYRTDQLGTIVLESDGASVQVKTLRNER